RPPQRDVTGILRAFGARRAMLAADGETCSESWKCNTGGSTRTTYINGQLSLSSRSYSQRLCVRPQVRSQLERHEATSSMQLALV
ncbi:MAG: hypothetical protein OEV36_05255, partial [Myxococcales bacterium]|nr:hypothetical protein [Myxococcales bacterium]